MTTPCEIIEDILTKIWALQNKPFAPSPNTDDFKIPRLIPTRNNKGPIRITKDIDDLITKLAKDLKTKRPSLAKSVKDDEWRVWVRTEIGPILAQISLSTPITTAAPTILNELNDALTNIVNGLSTKEYAFGTRMFSNSDMPSFHIGPITFEQREVWLDRKAASGAITSVTQRRIKQNWSGRRISPRKRNLHNILEDDIKKAIGPCTYVCTVELISNFASDAGLETALTAARLGLACAALAFETPSTVLRGFNLHYDGPVHLQKALLYMPNKTVVGGGKFNRDPHGPYVSAEDWRLELVRFASMFSGCSEVLNRLVGPDQSSPRLPVLDTLLQSLLWFEKGCREFGDLMAIVGFAASLDALGKGTKTGGILKVLDARLGIRSTDFVTSQGPTYESALELIYSDGRSRTVHGTNNKIGFDWGQTRAIAEQIARLALVACLDYVATTPTVLTPDDLKKP